MSDAKAILMAANIRWLVANKKDFITASIDFITHRSKRLDGNSVDTEQFSFPISLLYL
jgi:hypothetical protein